MVLATSGLTGDGVVEGIDWVAQCIVRNVHVRQGEPCCVFSSIPTSVLLMRKARRLMSALAGAYRCCFYEELPILYSNTYDRGKFSIDIKKFLWMREKFRRKVYESNN